MKHEHLTMHTAERLAARLEDHWHLRGYHGIKAWAAPISIPVKAKQDGSPKIGIAYAVRSNIGPSGFPPR